LKAEWGIIGKMPMPLWDFPFDEAGAFIFGGRASGLFLTWDAGEVRVSRR
jgi:hypothetical protein